MTSPAAKRGGLHAVLVELLGEDAVVSGDATLPYLQDQTSFQGLKGRADAVVRPGSAADVAAMVAWCYAEGVPIVPRGGGTGLAGGAVPTEGGVVCSMERLNRVLGFDPELWRMHVEAGVTTAGCEPWPAAAASSTPPTRAPASSRRSAATSPATPAGPTASSTGSPGPGSPASKR